MKKFTSITLAFVLCLALTGCGNKDEKAIQEVVNGYFAAFQSGDLSGAKAFCDDNVSDHTTMILSAEVMGSFTTDQFGDVFESEAKQFAKNTIGKFVKEYKLNSLSIEKGEAAMKKKLYDGVAPLLFQKIAESVGEIAVIDYTVEVKLQKQSDRWAITQLSR
ncbi:hypothetical protein [Bittarella massiliensis (ex Durand et al. 2017)]|uniref:hypothetical protein n=1 Tax=Bittarella massiliensis (ex Durand et al. 2017) TaxID=1720313 RepID=UPI001AA0D902|nr:hypothetical protein [Bittarella massiliensis (ex Durand et al. 2017)]MBO1679757.1 hypothetical protein [Bittarella massiliensis (ex Durand et al. 2017)]